MCDSPKHQQSLKQSGSPHPSTPVGRFTTLSGNYQPQVVEGVADDLLLKHQPLQLQPVGHALSTFGQSVASVTSLIEHQPLQLQPVGHALCTFGHSVALVTSLIEHLRTLRLVKPNF
eukprot:8401226-Pyramimonas_sp.AAC.1